ncbi:phosphoribosylamine--glycine ligase [Proteiniclasticum sp. C24MP]|uniref:phosphoribosylamine--glycine ligase n=1 Tax=Proteiniclasticum sp. C24MP TaxID=3374101 RepID=UPI0037549E45
MKILIIGEGAREHAIARKLAESDLVTAIYVSPGNGGTERLGKCRNISKGTLSDLRDFARDNNIDYTVVGPEADLMEGIVDLFHEADLKIIGPHRKAALLEGSKAYAKDFMMKYGIKTAEYEVFTDFKLAEAHIRQAAYPLVIKADGLAAGKGVEIIETYEDALKTLEAYMLEEKFKEASKKVVIEEYLTGKEASIITLFDGNSILSLNSTMDHKKIGEGETGLNTGGMGSLTPNPYFTEELEKDFRKNILDKTLVGLRAEQLLFKGIIFFGLMLTEKGTYLLEYNLRFGDPETQSLLETLESDLNTLFMKTLDGTLQEEDVVLSSDCALCVVLSAKGYPKTCEKEIDVSSFFDAETDQVSVFSYASKVLQERILSSSGRVLSVVSRGQKSECFKNVYDFLDENRNENLYYRNDIGRI